MPSANFPFGKEVKSYRQLATVTPYQDSKDNFDRPLGCYVHKAQIWRFAFFMTNIVIALMVVVFIMMLLRNPYSIVTLQVTEDGFLKAQPQLLTDRHEVGTNNIAEILRETLSSSNSILLNTLQKNINGANFVAEKTDSKIDVKLDDFKMTPSGEGGSFSGVLTLPNDPTVEFEITGSYDATASEDHPNEKSVYIKEINIKKVEL